VSDDDRPDRIGVARTIEAMIAAPVERAVKGPIEAAGVRFWPYPDRIVSGSVWAIARYIATNLDNGACRTILASQSNKDLGDEAAAERRRRFTSASFGGLPRLNGEEHRP
jgi:hypothetical protein